MQRISKILDVVIKSNLDLEYRLLKDNSEKLRNEYHLIIEQREMELRQRTILKEEDVKVRKLEYLVMQMESELEIVSDNSKEGNYS